MGNKSASDDLSDYRNGYPNQRDNIHLNDNYKFYNGEIPSIPDGDYIDNIHESWKGKYNRLEIHHGYIQWLFPIREHGMNSECQPLQLHEIQKMKDDPIIIERLLKSYDLILDFYGFVVEEKTTGKLKRAENWEERFNNLNTHSHNFLRITRILKCLGEFGFEHYKKPFLEFFITEIWENQTLKSCAQSCRNYWVGTIKNDEDRKELLEKIQKYYPNERRFSVDSSSSSSSEEEKRSGDERVGDL